MLLIHGTRGYPSSKVSFLSLCKQCYLHSLYYSCWQREAWACRGNTPSPSSGPRAATVLLGSVSEQSCGPWVSTGGLLFTDPTLYRWIGVGYQWSYGLWLAGECYRLIIHLLLDNECAKTVWYMVDRAGLHRTLYRGPKAVVIGLAAAWYCIHVELGSYHSPCIACCCFVKTVCVGRRRLHLQTLLPLGPDGWKSHVEWCFETW